MNNKEKAAELIRLLGENPDGVNRRIIERKLHISSESTFFRVINAARALCNGNIEVNDHVYSLKKCSETDGEISDVLPTDEELVALLTMQRIISGMTNGLLDEEFRPLRRKLDAILKTKVKAPHEWADSIKILDRHYRKISEGVYSQLVHALARKTAVKFTYTNSEGKMGGRTVSPQHLVRYRDNWYLDAWCHDRNALRIFSLDIISNIKHVNVKYHRCESAECNEIYATSYGIFSGAPVATAVIKLCGKAALYTKRESWHPEQKITQFDDGSVTIEIPFNKPQELIREILSWGDEAEIIEPQSLKIEVAEKIRKMTEKYGYV